MSNFVTLLLFQNKNMSQKHCLQAYKCKTHRSLSKNS